MRRPTLKVVGIFLSLRLFYAASSEPAKIALVILSSGPELRNAVRETWLRRAAIDYTFLEWWNSSDDAQEREAREFGDLLLPNKPSNASCVATAVDPSDSQRARLCAQRHRNETGRCYPLHKNYFLTQTQPEGDCTCGKSCQTGSLTLHGLAWARALASNWEYVLRIDEDGILCLAPLLAELSAAPTHYFSAYYYPQKSCRADENYMAMSRSVIDAVWRAFFGAAPPFIYRYHATFAHNANGLIALLWSLGCVAVRDERERIDSQQAWHSPAGLFRDLDPPRQRYSRRMVNASFPLAQTCARFTWVHKIKDAGAIRTIWSAMANSAAAAAPAAQPPDWAEDVAAYKAPFWTKPEGDPACRDETKKLADWSKARPEVQRAVKEWFPDCASLG